MYLFLGDGSNRTLEVIDLDQLEQLIDDLTRKATSDMPFTVELQQGQEDGAAMNILLGREESHVEFYSPHQSPLAIGCSGPWQGAEGEEIIIGLFGGQYSEIEKRYCIPVGQAMEGLRAFFRTGKRPSNIEWG